MVTSGNVTELRFTTDTADEHVIVLEHPNAKTQEAGQRQLAALEAAAGLTQVIAGADLHGRTVVVTADSFAAPNNRPDDDPPPPVRPEPERHVHQPEESSAAFAARVSRQICDPCPAWMDADDAA